MRQSVRVAVAGMALVGAFIPAGCMVLDALGPSGPRGLTWVYAGDTVLTVGQTTPVAVTVLAQGVPLPAQRLRIEISPDSIRVTVNLPGDSLIACRAGPAALLIRLLHSSAVGTATPDTSIGLHVTGGGSADPRCP